jgi:hypothetical protein
MKRLAALILILCAGCAANTVPADWVAGDRATYNAVAPEHAAYIDADNTLTLEQKQRRKNTLETWRVRVENHEAAINAGGGQ